eukprot:Em0004g1149a
MTDDEYMLWYLRPCDEYIRRRYAIVTASKQLGYCELRPNQRAAVRSFLKGRDVFVCLPTGSGKSLCYCLLPYPFDTLRHGERNSLVLVVSPLISHMKDQVRAVKEKNLSAVYGLEEEEQNEICNSRYQLIFVSPEALLDDERWREILMDDNFQENLVALAIDEAHCVKKWKAFVREKRLLHNALFCLTRGETFPCTTASVKDAILQSFCHSTGSNLHVVIATVALGMGLAVLEKSGPLGAVT